MGLFVWLFGLWSLYALSSFYALLKNYSKARRMGLPLLVNPLNTMHILWMVFAPLLQPVAVQWLPMWLYKRFIPGLHGGVWINGWATFKELGPVFAYVTPAKIELHVADPDFTNGIWSWKEGYKVDPDTENLLALQGPNVFSASGEDWKRQRKIIAPLLNERFSSIAWDESSRQAIQMAEYFEAKQPTNNLACDGLETISINILGAVGYGVYQSWTPSGSVNSNSDNDTMVSFFASLSVQTQHFFAAALLPTWLLSLPIMPKLLRNIGAAKNTFPVHAQQMIDIERRNQAEKSVGRDNFISTLVGFLKESKKEIGEKENMMQPSNALYMTDQEVRGNLFIFSVAGYETTAHTLSFGITHLAAYPEWQEWLCQEIDAVVAEKEPSKEFSYAAIFPRLIRCFAFLYEITRLYSPVGNASRWVTVPQTVAISSPTGIRTHTIPTGTCIVFSLRGTHLNPAIYGPDPTLFDPTRWISTSTTDSSESFINPRKGTHMAWSGGPRSCPGIRMAQVEFVSFIFAILRQWKIEAASPPGNQDMTLQEAQHSLRQEMKASREQLTLSITRPENIWLKWQRRK